MYSIHLYKDTDIRKYTDIREYTHANLAICIYVVIVFMFNAIEYAIEVNINAPFGL